MFDCLNLALECAGIGIVLHDIYIESVPSAIYVSSHKSAILQVQLDYNDNKELLKVSWMTGSLIVYWDGVLIRLILIKMNYTYPDECSNKKKYHSC